MTETRTQVAATVASAEATKTATLITNEQTKQASIEASRTVVGLVLQNGNAAYVTAVKAANQAKFLSDQAAEVARQAAIAVARDLLRASGTDSGSF
jgi:hypothetical protein